MKHLLSIFGIALAALTFTACGGDDPEPNPDPDPKPEIPVEDLSDYKKIDYKVRDLALIYQGGTHRIDWTEEEFYPYVTHRFMNGDEEWIFDGYLFLEFTSGTNGGKQFTAGYGQPNATKVEWEWYLGRLFEKSKALDALDKAIDRKKTTLGEPPFKHKVALTCFVPIQAQKDWGELDGVALDFTREADRTKAGTWFVDQLINRFEAARYKNLELYGIYMICEEASTIQNYCRSIKAFTESKNLDFLWIPYYGASGAGQWESWGFDIAYQQPNYFFNQDHPKSLLDNSIQFARNNKMALELECDERALFQSTPCFRNRLIDYMDYFEEYGVWYDTPVAYYTGNHMFLDMLRQPAIQNTQIMDRLCRYIVNRRKVSLQ